MAEGTVFSCFSAASVAATYEDIYVPRIFIPWARLLIDEARLRPGEQVVDVATGPGTVARLAAERVGPGGRVVATDISAAMLALARQKPRLPGAAEIHFVESPAASLTAPGAAFDVVTCQQGLQPTFAAIQSALRECLSADAADLYGAPFRWPNGKDLEAALRGQGFQEVAVRDHRLPLVYEGGTAQALATLAASPAASQVAEMRDADRARLWKAGERNLEPLLRKGEIHAEMVSNMATAQRP
ncbi:MAG TPA: methyltransferase domain-containing protein [Chloroflexota bacterium]|jgi:SAM-dependent methyltransferase